MSLQYEDGEVVEIRELDKDGNPTGDWIALKKTMGGLVVDRPRPEVDGSLREERPMMDTTAPMNPLADILGRLATVAEKWLENTSGSQGATQPSADPKYLTPQEVAEILRVNVQSVLKWCRQGKLGASKHGGNKVNGKGGKYLIPREEVDRYLRRHQVINGKPKGGA